MINSILAQEDNTRSAFVPGQRVFLAEGPYTSTVGIFRGLRRDVNWADIQKPNGEVTTHPVCWLRHCPEGDLNWNDLLRPPATRC